MSKLTKGSHNLVFTDGVKLKHYRRYLNTLKRFANAMDITVIYNEDSEESVWIPKTKTITLEYGLSQSNIIASFLHELGHVIDDFSITDHKMRNKLNVAYAHIYSDKYTKRQQKIVYDAEERAWNIGRNLAQRLSIPLGVWYDDIASFYLSTYAKL